MDDENEVQKFKWLLIAILAFGISGWYSWTELRYATWGKTVDAEIVRMHETTRRSRRGITSTWLVIDYQFSEPGASVRSESDEVPNDNPRPEGGKVAVEYVPGKPGMSRLAGHRNVIAVVIFGLTLLWLAYQGFQLFREAREASRPRTSGRRKR